MLTRYDAFSDLFRVHDQVFGRSPLAARAPEGFVPVVDVYEDEHGLVFEAELPGVKLEDVDLELEKNVLTLRGERKLAKETGVDERWRAERRWGRFERAFRLPDAVNVESAKAEMKDGVLMVRFAKKAEERPRRIEITATEDAPERKAA